MRYSEDKDNFRNLMRLSRVLEHLDSVYAEIEDSDFDVIDFKGLQEFYSEILKEFQETAHRLGKAKRRKRK